MAHLHLTIAILFLIAGHMYRTNFGIGHSIKDVKSLCSVSIQQTHYFIGLNLWVLTSFILTFSLSMGVFGYWFEFLDLLGKLS
jgi:hypothetical protein